MKRLISHIDKKFLHVLNFFIYLEDKWQKFFGKSAILRLLRFDRPSAYLFLFAPIYWTIAMSTQSIFLKSYYSLVFGIEAIVMRSFGCIINDILDRAIDKKTERCKSRPLANGDISLKTAVIILIILAAVAIFVGMALPLKILLLAAVVIPPAAILYALSKRFTKYPQIVLGFVFNMGVWFAWFCLNDKIHYIPALIYLAAILWNIGYDIIYAHQDYNDDIRNNVGSMAAVLGPNIGNSVWSLYRASAMALAIAGINAQLGLGFYLIGGASFYVLYWQCKNFDFKNPELSAKMFKANSLYALYMMLACSL